MKPYLVERIENYTGTVVKKTVPKKYEKLMTSQEASQLKTYMIWQVMYMNGLWKLGIIVKE